MALTFALLLVPALALAAGGDVLVDRLPAEKVVFYAQMDTGPMLAQLEQVATFVDADTGQKMIYQAKELYSLLQEAAAAHEFRPELFGHASETTCYVVVMLKDEPVVREETERTPKMDWETFEPIEGEFDERTITVRDAYTVSAIVRAPDNEVASDFMAQWKALLAREAEKEPDNPEYQRRDYDVEMGELIGSAGDRSTVGRIGEYIVLSDDNPTELWAALMAPPARTVSDTYMYSRLVTTEQTPQAYVLVNVKALVRQAEGALKRNLGEAEKNAAETGDDGQQPPWAGSDFALQVATASYEAFMAAKEILSLDQLQQIGGSIFYDASGERVFSDAMVLLSHGDAISSVLRELLAGSGTFQVPPGEQKGMCVMCRVGWKEIYDEVVAILMAREPQAVAQYQMAMQMMKMTIGTNVAEILGMLEGDSYMFVDIVEKERDVVTDFQFNEETGEWDTTTEKKVVPMPVVTMLWGLRDSRGALATLSNVFTMLSANPQASAMVKTRTYQETDVFCFGVDAAKEETFPDGMTSFAFVVVDRYLSMGSWDYVTGLVRQMKSGAREVDAELQPIADKHRDSNFLAVMPKAFQEALQKRARDRWADQAEAFDMMLSMLDEAELDLGDPELTERVKKSLQDLLTTYQAWMAKAQELAPQTVVLTGTHKGDHYEMRSTNEVRK